MESAGSSYSRSDEALLLTILGMTILIAGAAEAAHGLLRPMRDLFAAMFLRLRWFVYRPCQDLSGSCSGQCSCGRHADTKLATGWIGAARSGVGLQGRARAGAILTARGEFSIAIAGLAAAAGVAANFEALAILLRFVVAFLAGWPIRSVGAGVGDPAPGRLDSDVPKAPWSKNAHLYAELKARVRMILYATYDEACRLLGPLIDERARFKGIGRINVVRAFERNFDVYMAHHFAPGLPADNNITENVIKQLNKKLS